MAPLMFFLENGGTLPKTTQDVLKMGPQRTPNPWKNEGVVSPQKIWAINDKYNRYKNQGNVGSHGVYYHMSRKRHDMNFSDFHGILQQVHDDAAELHVWNAQSKMRLPFQTRGSLLLMEEILHHLGCIKPCKKWDVYHINWCRISSINSGEGEVGCLNAGYQTTAIGSTAYFT